MKPNQLLVTSRFFSTLAFQILVFLAFANTFSESGSALKTGSIGLALYLSSALLAIPAGLWSQRMRRTGQNYFNFQLLQLLILPLFLGGLTTPALMFAAVAILSAHRTLRGPVYYAILKETQSQGAGSARLARHNTLSWKIPLVIGPMLGSTVILVLNARYLILMVFVLELISVAFSLGLRTVQAKPRLSAIPEKPSLDSKVTDPIFADMVLAGFLGLNALLPFLLQAQGLPGTNYGFYKSLLHFSALVTVLSLSSARLHKTTIRTFSFLIFLWGLSGLLLTGNVFLMITGLISLGVIDGLSSLYREKVLLEFSTTKNAGVLSSLNSFCIATGDELGEFTTGIIVSALGIRTFLMVNAGIATGVASILNFRRTSGAKSKVFLGAHQEIVTKIEKRKII